MRAPGPGVRAAAGALAAAVLIGGASAGPAAADSLVTVLDNSHADSVVEVDRTANVQHGSGTAGSDHDGSAVAVLATLVGGAEEVS